MGLFISAKEIRRWAEVAESRSMLPHVIRRLVWATLDLRHVDRIDFPAYESVQRPGFDGEVNCRKGNAWVPDGESVWELSVESKVGAKANNDFETRTKNPPPEVRQKSTYVCLTARHWRDKKDWASEKRALGEWNDVRAFDADDIEQWGERAPFGFKVWFGRQVGTRSVGIDYVAERWKGVSQIGSLPLDPKVFLAGRQRSVKRFEEWLGGAPVQLQMTCRSPAEIVDFACAAIAAMQAEDRERVESRAVIVGSKDAWAELRDGTTPSVLIVEPSILLPAQEVSRAVRNGHHVLAATEPAFHNLDQSIELDRAREFELQQALEESGYTPVQAEQFARSAGGSLAILKHRLAPSHIELPDCSQGLSSEVLGACLLLGGWAEKLADLEAFTQIAGRPYAECEAELQRMANGRDPLLLHAVGNWRLISKDHAWSLFQDRVTPTALRVFETLAVDILSDDDPRYQLPEDRRLFANFSGHVPRFSETIKRHVAETLAFLGAFGSRLQAAASIDVTSTVDRIVSAVLSPTCTWHRWASIGSKLPLLAEASPRIFLNAVRSDLSKTESELVTLLHEEEETLLGRCNHAGLLWALETLAWPKSLLPEVARSLLVLASRDTPKGKWGNRPSSTLCEILLYWLPQTTATVEERIQVLDLLVQTDRAAALPALIKFLPQSTGGVSDPTHRPYWRNWANEWVKDATTGGSLTFITATAERVVEEAGIDVDWWKQIFENIGRFPYTVRDRLFKRLDELCDTDISDSNRRLLSDELSEQVNRHRYFANSKWSLPLDVVDRLEGFLNRLKPQDPVFRHAWLFAISPDRFFKRSDDYVTHQAALEKARHEALQEILSHHGFAGVELLLKQAKSPRFVAVTLANLTGNRFVEPILPEYLEGDAERLEFAEGFISARFYPDGWSWVDENITRCRSTTEKAKFLCSLGFSRPVWDRVETFGDDVSQAYWKICRPFNPQLQSQDVEAAVQKLIQHMRPADTLDLLSMAIHQKRELSVETLLGPLEALMKWDSGESQDQLQRLDANNIQIVIEELQSRTDIDQNRLVRVEWHFIRLLDSHCGNLPRTLHNYLSTSPEFFHEVLSYCYRSRISEIEEEQESTEHQRFMAEHAYRLLSDWSLLPGTTEEGSIDEVRLREWCIAARLLARESGRLEVCDEHIGQLFSRCQLEDSDGKCPCSAVRNVASEIASDSLRSGMICGIRNLRDVCIRSSGGDPERTLAETFRERADRIRFESPFVAEVLDTVANSYNKEAREWDELKCWENG